MAPLPSASHIIVAAISVVIVAIAPWAAVIIIIALEQRPVRTDLYSASVALSQVTPLSLPEGSILEILLLRVPKIKKLFESESWKWMDEKLMSWRPMRATTENLANLHDFTHSNSLPNKAPFKLLHIHRQRQFSPKLDANTNHSSASAEYDCAI